MSMKAEYSLKSALLSTALVQPVDSKATGGKYLEVLCRQMPGQEKPWLTIVRDMLLMAAREGFELHICRRYIIKDNQLAFGWNIGIGVSSSKKLEGAVNWLAQVLSNAKPVLMHESERLAPAHVTQQSRPVMGGHRIDRGAKLPSRPSKAGKDRMLPLPRAANQAGAVEEAPPGFVPTITEIQRTVDEETQKEVIVTEMPLPHVYRDHNKPNAKGRGAKFTAPA